MSTNSSCGNYYVMLLLVCRNLKRWQAAGEKQNMFHEYYCLLVDDHVKSNSKSYKLGLIKPRCFVFYFLIHHGRIKEGNLIGNYVGTVYVIAHASSI